MKIADLMTPSVDLVDPSMPIRDAAARMRDDDVGALPVGENDRLVGMVTDRDIVVRGVATGKALERLLVREVMTPQVLYCFEDQDCEEVAKNMAEVQARRLPVINRDKRLVGIVSLGDFARNEPEAAKTAEIGVTASAA